VLGGRRRGSRDSRSSGGRRPRSKVAAITAIGSPSGRRQALHLETATGRSSIRHRTCPARSARSSG
jgi:hypothetical protein